MSFNSGLQLPYLIQPAGIRHSGHCRPYYLPAQPGGQVVSVLPLYFSEPHLMYEYHHPRPRLSPSLPGLNYGLIPRRPSLREKCLPTILH